MFFFFTKVHCIIFCIMEVCLFLWSALQDSLSWFLPAWLARCCSLPSLLGTVAASCNCFVISWETTCPLLETGRHHFSGDCSGPKSRWKSSICNFILDTANPSVTDILLYTSPSDAWKGWSLFTTIKGSEDTTSSSPPVGIQEGSFWKATQNQKMYFSSDWSLDSEQSASQPAFVKQGNIFGFIVLMKEKEREPCRSRQKQGICKSY